MTAPPSPRSEPRARFVFPALLLAAGLVLFPLAVVLGVFRDRRQPPTQEQAEAARADLATEIRVSAKYGVRWPEAEALTRVHGEPAALINGFRHAERELVRRRKLPELWRPLPARDLSTIFRRDGRLYRQVWLPDQGTIVEPIWKAAEEWESGIGFWEPFSENDHWHRDVQRVAFERYAPLLGEALSTERRPSESSGLRAVAGDAPPLTVEGVEYFGGPAARFGIAWVMPEREASQHFVLLPVQGLRLYDADGELTVRHPVRPNNPLGDATTDLPTLILFELR